MYLIEWNDVLGIYHVDESVANVAFILKRKRKNKTKDNSEKYPSCSHSNDEKRNNCRKLINIHTCLKINRQINKIISSPMTLINRSQEHLRCIPVKPSTVKKKYKHHKYYKQTTTVMSLLRYSQRTYWGYFLSLGWYENHRHA